MSGRLERRLPRPVAGAARAARDSVVAELVPAAGPARRRVHLSADSGAHGLGRPPGAGRPPGRVLPVRVLSTGATLSSCITLYRPRGGGLLILIA